MSFLAMTVKVDVGLVVPNGMSKEEMEKRFEDYLLFIKGRLMYDLETQKVSVVYDGSILTVKVPKDLPTQTVRTKCVERTVEWKTTNLPLALLMESMPPPNHNK